MMWSVHVGFASVLLLVGQGKSKECELVIMHIGPLVMVSKLRANRDW